MLLFAPARELSHVCLSAEVACLRCAAYEAVGGIRSGRDKLSVLLDAEVAYGFGVIPLVQRLAPALHRVKPVSYTHLDVYKRQHLDGCTQTDSFVTAAVPSTTAIGRCGCKASPGLRRDSGDFRQAAVSQIFFRAFL